jgi:AcrR family transcriptional regulator
VTGSSSGAVARRRGRPSGGTTDARERIIASARILFADKGFDGASIRAIAAEADVDASLIRHYFGDKSGLLVATMQLPVNPVELIGSLLSGGPDGLASRLLTTFLGTWDQHPDVIAGVIRTAVSSAEAGSPFVQMMKALVLPRLVDVLPGTDRDLRATLVMSQVAGLAVARYVLRLDSVATAPAAAVVAAYSPSLQRLIDG